jgi:hypothetical protein
LEIVQLVNAWKIPPGLSGGFFGLSLDKPSTSEKPNKTAGQAERDFYLLQDPKAGRSPNEPAGFARRMGFVA